MDRVKISYFLTLSKSHWKEILGCCALLFVVVFMNIGQTLSSGNIEAYCQVTARGTKFGIDGNKPFVICSLKGGKEVSVFTSEAASLEVGKSIKVTIVDRPLWFSDRYLYEGIEVIR